MARRPVGIDTSELKGRGIFGVSTKSKVFGALHSTQSRGAADRKTASIMAVINAAAASPSTKSSGGLFVKRNRPLAEPHEIQAGLDSLLKSKQISPEDAKHVKKALERDMNN